MATVLVVVVVLCSTSSSSCIVSKVAARATGAVAVAIGVEATLVLSDLY